MLTEINISEIEGFRIGHAQDTAAGTGVTAIICESGAAAGIDMRGGGPASRETPLLNPLMAAKEIHAVLLTGGSAYGLSAANGAMQFLAERGVGVAVGDIRVPLVCQSCIFDLSYKRADVYPTPEMAYAACENAFSGREITWGSVGGGCGATVGKMMGMDCAAKSGVGVYAAQLGALKVGAIAVVNAIGDVYDELGARIAGVKGDMDSETLLYVGYAHSAAMATNTTICAIVTNAALDKTAMNKVAALASNGLARAIRPVNLSMDGDAVYALSCGTTIAASADVVGTLAARVLHQAIINAVIQNKV